MEREDAKMDSAEDELDGENLKALSGGLLSTDRTSTTSTTTTPTRSPGTVTTTSGSPSGTGWDQQSGIGA